MACPLLLFWPLVCEVRGGAGGGGGAAGQEEGEDAVMEMRLRENPQQFSSALLQLATRYLTVLGVQVLQRQGLTHAKHATKTKQVWFCKP